MNQAILSFVLAAVVAAPGAAGAGDPYFPQDGNGGYDVRHYDLAVGYDPTSGVLTGHATVDAVTTQKLSAFDLDLTGLTVNRVTVGGTAARWTRDGGELVITPAAKLADRVAFTVVVDYSGVPQVTDDPEIGTSGFVRTDDGFVIAGEPHGAATWYPANDHPSDKATYAFHVTVPDGLTAIANGRLTGNSSRGGRTTWNYAATAPMASYLATVSVGRYDLRSYTANGVRYTDAVDSALTAPEHRPRTGSRMLYSQAGVPAYKRISHLVDVPASGGSLGFHAHVNTADSAYLFVEAHTVGDDDWTTLPDETGYQMRDWAGSMCDGTLPFLAHYMTREADGSCSPTGTTGAWWALSSFNSGPGDDSEVTFDLARYAGKQVELSVTYATKPAGPGEDSTERLGVFLDDVTVSTGQGSTSFEADGDTMDGWTASPASDDNGWKSITAAQAPAAGYVITRALARQPEIMEFLTSKFGPYPFTEAGAVVDDAPLSFALETQTRPTYPSDVFWYEDKAVSTVVHELAHQWFGDAVSVEKWRDIWLNEGFATYAQWLWDERNGSGTAQQQFDRFYGLDDEYWARPLDDSVTSPPVYLRGAMTLHVLRNRVGDDTFFRILRTWVATHKGGNASSADFQATAERVSGRQLADIFTAWVFEPGKPTVVK
ncbi:M1 family metallopeptidase [Micromonospora musae]|uniref:M1 family metallopeptidase n=1 Tax=Micromonospora musae TaxID=1894970 RepID=UPI003409BD01